jgi:hypothetical protein
LDVFLLPPCLHLYSIYFSFEFSQDKERLFVAKKAMEYSIWFNNSLLKTNETIRDQVRLVTKMMDHSLEAQELCYDPVISP